MSVFLFWLVAGVIVHNLNSCCKIVSYNTVWQGMGVIILWPLVVLSGLIQLCLYLFKKE